MKLLFFLTFLFISVLSFAQQRNTYVINLADKGNSYSISSPASFLTPQSVERRKNQLVAIDHTDVPVNEEYVNKIASTGAKVLIRSRWFNLVVIESTEDQYNTILAEEFVLSGKQISGNNAGIKTEKAFFENELIHTSGINRAVLKTTNTYDYGFGINQIEMLNGIDLHNRGFDGEGITIAVLDAGFENADQLDVFDSLFVSGRMLGTRNFAEPGQSVYTSGISAHGTMVLSTMGGYWPGQLVGTAPKANYWLLRTEYAPTETLIEEYYWLAGAEFADSVGAHLINSSLGYTEFDNPAENHTYENMDGNTTVVTIAADMAAKKGILVVNSAGNSGDDPWYYIGAPADGDSVLSVGAVDYQGHYAYFSSHGPTYDGRIKPNVVAQGAGSAIANSFGSVSFGSGTSFSSPILAGITACLLQAYPAMNNMQIIKSLESTASYKDNPTDTCGYGIPDVVKAYNYLKELSLSDTGKESISCYPNPFSNVLNLKFPPATDRIYNIAIYSVTGQLVYSKNHTLNADMKLTITGLDLVPGIYFLTATSSKDTMRLKIIRK